jgi:hypothetical protein
VEFGLCFKTTDGLLVRSPGASSFVRMPMQLDDDAHVLWPDASSLLVVDKHPPGLRNVTLQKSFFAQLAAARARLPQGLVAIDAVAVWDTFKTSVVVGKNANNDVVIAMVYPAPTPVPVVLPQGAVFRGLRPSPDNLMGRFIVDYTLPGDAPEPESLRHVVVDLWDTVALGA